MMVSVLILFGLFEKMFLAVWDMRAAGPGLQTGRSTDEVLEVVRGLRGPALARCKTITSRVISARFPVTIGAGPVLERPSA